MDKGDNTRARVIEAAERLILERGFAGTSLDDLLRETKLTKGGFFHHFKSKGDLARAVVEGYAENDYALFKRWSEEADAASTDPLERVMYFLTAFERFLDDLGKPFPGCVFASYTYESRQFSPEIHAYIRDRLRAWLGLYEEKLAALIGACKPREKVTARALAEMIVTIVEGGFVMGNALNDATWLQRQSAQYRAYLKLLFA
jgi:TetR/AcrR family transcriptional repressor of nem operon